MKYPVWTLDPAAAAREVRARCPQAAEAALLWADQLCRREFIFPDHWEMERTHAPVVFSGRVDWEQTPNGDMEWIYALNRHSFLMALAKAWLLTRETRYSAALEEYLSDWLDRMPHTPERESTAWRSLEAGLRPERWLRVREWMGADFPPALAARMDESLARHGEYLARSWTPFHRLSNWGAIQSHGLFLTGLHLGREDWQALALERLAENLENALLPDGVQWEQSPMYHCEVLHAAADTLMQARRSGAALPRGLEERVRRMFRALAAWAAPDRTILPQSDSDRIDAGDLLAQGALLFGDPELAAAAAGPVCEETIWDFGPEGVQQLAALPAQRPACPSQALTASGNYQLRSGWGREDTFAHLHVGSLGGGHGHADLLHLDLWHKGEAVLTDGGRYTYVECAERRYLKSPAAHNTLRLDGEDFTGYRDTWGWDPVAQPLPAAHCFTPEADYVCGGHLGYGPRGAILWRKAVLLKPDLVVLCDCIQTREGAAHTAQQFFHFGQGTLRQEGDSVLWQGEHTAAQLCWLSGQRPRLYQSPRAAEYNLLQQGPALELETDAVGSTGLVCVISLGGPCQTRLLPVTTGTGQPVSPADAQAVEIRREDRTYTVLFHHRPGPGEAGLLCAGGCTGHGPVMIVTPNTPHGLCLG